MSDIRQIIASNIASLRKKNNMTQNELAERLNYSDNAVSRWERGDVTPSIETLQQISEIFSVPLESFFKENVVVVLDNQEKYQRISKLSVMLLFVALIWFIVAVVFVYAQTILGINLWTMFVWSVPLSCLILLPFNELWGKTVYKFVLLSVFIWTTLASLYLQLLQYNIWLIFITGIPVQLALVIWAFIKPKKRKE
ncbi:MAG: helix-turn-helix transcriptional regulator [Clostridiales bacterium]|nr:helix-turn-helix transcriptional regulator [Clostridiales bacterium]